MPYKVIAAEVTIPKKVGEMSDQHGNKLDEHVSVTYYLGDVLKDEDVAPTVQRAYEDGEAHILTLIEKTSDEPTVEMPTVAWADAYPIGEAPLTPAEEDEKKVTDEKAEEPKKASEKSSDATPAVDPTPTPSPTPQVTQATQATPKAADKP